MDCLKFTEDSFLIAFLLMMKIAYRTLYQLIENHVVLIMCYGTVLMGLQRLFTVFLSIYLLQNFMHMAYQKMR